jgi:dihydrodipicolinate synthase/N-acetylneuraminate lyase
MSSMMLEAGDFARSVVAVPPLALGPDLAVAGAANAALICHIARGGVGILLYGGNANLYHIDLGRFRDLLDVLVAEAGPALAMVPSIGPDFGKMLDQAPILRATPIRSAMVLPTAFPSDPAGLERGLSAVADALGFSLVLYIKRDGYIDPARLERLLRSGVVRFVKYAVERTDPAEDRYLAGLLSAIGPAHIASGMGETPLHVHMVRDRMATFTSGGVCIAPAAAMALLAAYQSGDLGRAERIRAPFLRFEAVRSRLGGIQTLHDAVSYAGIADMGPILPLLSNVAADDMPAVREVTDGLMAIEREVVGER